MSLIYCDHVIMGMMYKRNNFLEEIERYHKHNIDCDRNSDTKILSPIAQSLSTISQSSLQQQKLIIDDDKKNNSDASKGDEEAAAEDWNRTGLVKLYMLNQIPEAVECFQKALLIFEHLSLKKTSCTVSVAVTLNDLAKCYEQLDDPIKALALYKRASNLLERSKDIVNEKHPAIGANRRAMVRLCMYQDSSTSRG